MRGGHRPHLLRRLAGGERRMQRPPFRAWKRGKAQKDQRHEREEHKTDSAHDVHRFDGGVGRHGAHRVGPFPAGSGFMAVVIAFMIVKYIILL